MNLKRQVLALGALGALAAVAAAPAGVAPAGAQAPTASATASATALPVPDLAGEWSVSRTWFRQCPACGGSIARTTAWTVAQQGSSVRVDKGPRGALLGTADGGAWLTLEGLESGADGVLRFHYGTLRVAPGGSSFEGSFAGSERIANPCAQEPPVVTCFVSGGWLEARRRWPLASTTATATGSPSSTGTAPVPVSPTDPPTTIVPSTAPGGTATPALTPTDTAAPLPAVRAFLPDCRRQLRP